MPARGLARRLLYPAWSEEYLGEEAMLRCVTDYCRLFSAALLVTATLCQTARSAVFVHSTQADFAAGLQDSTATDASDTVFLDSQGLWVYTEDRNSAPRAQVWNGDGLDTAIDALDVGFLIFRLELAASPLRREAILTALGTGGEMAAQVWDGTAFSNLVSLGTGWTAPDHPQIAVSYEGLSGHAMLIYERGPSSPFYRIWDGASWGAERVVGLGNSMRPTDIFVAADPGSNRIIAGTVDGESLASGNAYAAVWGRSDMGRSHRAPDGWERTRREPTCQLHIDERPSHGGLGRRIDDKAALPHL